MRAALGAFVVCFRKPVDAAELLKAGELLAEVQRVVEGCGFGWDGVCLAVAMPQSRTPFLVRSEGEWEDWGREWGFEVVDFEGRGRNEFSGMCFCVLFFGVFLVFKVVMELTRGRTEGCGEVEGGVRG